MIKKPKVKCVVLEQPTSFGKDTTVNGDNAVALDGYSHISYEFIRAENKKQKGEEKK